MCGIFGIFSNNLKNYSKNKLLDDISTIANLSSVRGSDTFGISLFLKNKIYTYKSFKSPELTVNCEIFKERIIKNIRKNNLNSVSYIGQTRLVTTGSKFIYENNQPIVTNKILGIHNGIFFEKKLFNKYKKVNFEDYNQKSDSSIFFEEIDKLDKKNFIKSYLKFIKQKKGNYSIAFRHITENKIIISSNTGSLFYIYDAHSNFYFASEKKNIKEIY